MAKRKPEGSHKFLHMIVCDRCGHKESWGDRWTAMAAHVKQHLSERPPGPEPGGRKVPSRSIGPG